MQGVLATEWDVIQESGQTLTECLPIEGGLLYRTTVWRDDQAIAVALVFVPHGPPMRDEDL